MNSSSARIAERVSSESAVPVPTIVVGIKPWKRWQIDRFLRRPGCPLYYAASAAEALRKQARQSGRIVIWAAREPEGFAAEAAAQGAELLRMEDGFLRSAGLGSNHVGGASLVIDETGIYFDARRPSALENLLQTGGFDSALLVRAAKLRKHLVQRGLTKYNLGQSELPELGAAPHQRVVLVPGQVEDDASIRFGAPGVCSNLDLLKQVRVIEPNAWIVYKPHPDIEARTRPGAVPDDSAMRYANQIVRNGSVTALFASVNRVHTMTSLVGFEALLRGIPVTTWGQPFYAGWGLTDDRIPLLRRTRRIVLDELVAAALILYPHYVDPVSGNACEVETVVEWLSQQPAVGCAGQRSATRRIARLLQGLYLSWKSARANG